jgi:tripartite-type tricarboxylate transporter receptor subunit TctC
VINRLSKALQDALASPGFKQAMDTLGTQIASADKAAPEGLRRHLDAEVKKWAPILGTQIASADKATPEGLRRHLDAEVKKWAPIIHAAKAYAD